MPIIGRQERDKHGRYAHRYAGVVAQDARGDIERCEGCGALRASGGRRVDPATVAPEAWIHLTYTGPGSRYDIQPIRKARRSG